MAKIDQEPITVKTIIVEPQDVISRPSLAEATQTEPLVAASEPKKGSTRFYAPLIASLKNPNTHANLSVAGLFVLGMGEVGYLMGNGDAIKENPAIAAGMLLTMLGVTHVAARLESRTER